MKYRNIKVKNRLGNFDSKIEACRFIYLSDLEAKGIISNLRRQIRYQVIPHQYSEEYEVVTKTKTKTKVVKKKDILERPTYYIADFVYEHNGNVVVEDVKSEITRQSKEYIIKRKLMLYVNKIKIKEVTHPTQNI